MKILAKSPEDTADVARKCLSALFANPAKEKATVVGLYGDLGSGKTTFTKAVAEELGIKEVITSPTFVIEKSYTIQHPNPAHPHLYSNFKRLIHIDAYRLEKGSELARLGWSERLSDPTNLILIEWPEHVADVMPEGHNIIKFRFVDSMTREIDTAILAV